MDEEEFKRSANCFLQSKALSKKNMQTYIYEKSSCTCTCIMSEISIGTFNLEMCMIG